MTARAVLLALLLPAGMAGAVDPADLDPAPEVCPAGRIAAGTGCVAPDAPGVDDAARLDAARALAASGEARAALAVLAAVEEESATLHALRGRALREAGDVAASLAAYEKALALDPGNLEARSYYGQSLIAAGEPEAARAQLLEIRERGGRGTLAYTELKRALRGGGGY